MAALGAGPERLLADLEWFGLLFESLVIRDLRVYSQPLAGDVSHDRDDDGLEVEAIRQLLDGRWAAIEIKLGEGHVDRAASVSGGDLRQGLRLPPAGWHRGGAGGGAGALSQASASPNGSLTLHG
jgi:hypothetical protein